jgi:hypothetical protein
LKSESIDSFQSESSIILLLLIFRGFENLKGLNLLNNNSNLLL